MRLNRLAWRKDQDDAEVGSGWERAASVMYVTSAARVTSVTYESGPATLRSRWRHVNSNTITRTGLWPPCHSVQRRPHTSIAPGRATMQPSLRACPTGTWCLQPARQTPAVPDAEREASGLIGTSDGKRVGWLAPPAAGSEWVGHRS